MMKQTQRIGSLAIAVLALALGAPAHAQPASTRSLVPIGIDGVPGKGDKADGKIAEDLKLNFYKTLLPWIEDSPGVYAWSGDPGNDRLRERLMNLKVKGFKIQLVESTVHMDQKHPPKVMEGKRFDDPEVIERWEAYLTALMQQYGDCIDFFSIGNEVVSYFGNKEAEWKEYAEFFKRGAAVVHRVRPGIQIGIVLAEENPGHFWDDIKDSCDYFGYNYYTPCSAFEKAPTADALDPASPKYFPKVLDTVLSAAKKKVLISEIGCATHPSIDSSPELQAQFIRLLFKSLREREDRILGLSWLSISDWPYEGTRQGLKGYLDEKLLSHEPFLRYLTSLGLLFEDGTPKPGFGVYKEELERYRAEGLK